MKTSTGSASQSFSFPVSNNNRRETLAALASTGGLVQRSPSFASLTTLEHSQSQSQSQSSSQISSAPLLSQYSASSRNPFDSRPSLSASRNLRVSFPEPESPDNLDDSGNYASASIISDIPLYIKNLWIAYSFWLCGGRPQDRIIISILLILFVGLLTALFTYNTIFSEPNSNNQFSQLPTTADIDNEILILNSDFPYDVSTDRTVSFSSDWYADRRYGIIIDAGSSGSRLLIYSWRKFNHPSYSSNSLPIIEKAFPSNSSQPWFKSIEPGLSSLSNTKLSKSSVQQYLEPILLFAASTIPAIAHQSTPIYLLATAGMRLISSDSRDKILKYACDTTLENFKFDIRSCSTQFRVISGEVEGIFGWVAINYLNSGFQIPNKQRPPPLPGSPSTFGFLDMGGASTQIAFEPIEEMKKLHADDLTKVVLRNVGGSDLEWLVFVSTFLGFGVNEARRNYLQELAVRAGFHFEETAKRRAETITQSFSKIENSTVPYDRKNSSIQDPCLSAGLVIKNDKYLSNLRSPQPLLHGTGSLLQCLSNLNSLLKKNVPCPEQPCLFNGVHAPIANFSKHRFMGISEYYYTPTSVSGAVHPQTGAYYFGEFVKSADQICQGPFDQLRESYMEAHGNISAIEELRLQLQCFKSAWVFEYYRTVLEILHDGFGIPKNELLDSSKTISLSTSAFTPINEINGFPISWTIGAMLFHVSSTIPPTLMSSEIAIVRQLLEISTLVVAILLGVIFWRRYRRIKASMNRRRSSRIAVTPLTSIWPNHMDEEILLGNIPIQEDI
ncbi:Golgi apyrase [Physocladia obscura]|uniref:Golgi apyrase n=1 Tax=Physocladia obscura TaxID=109957 RepID=A0AAD5XGA1_9FUNG|nr:Golgi apyrase [Physocladia obscura]